MQKIQISKYLFLKDLLPLELTGCPKGRFWFGTRLEIEYALGVHRYALEYPPF